MAIRNTAKAILLHHKKILVNKCRTDDGEVYYDLPGGGQNQFETMEDAVVREVLEETGYKVKVERFIALAEEIHDNNAIKEQAFDYSHRIIHVFLAMLLDENQSECSETDFQQETSMWLSIEEANKLVFRPSLLTGRVRDIVESDNPQYLGSVRVN